MKHIVVIVHRNDRFDQRDFLLREMMNVWREDGIRVSVVSDPNEFIDADLAVLHVDLTVIPEAYRVLARRYPRVVNGRVFDISKRRFTAHEVKRGDGYSGQVIVKTNRNSGGVQEHLHDDSVIRRASMSRRNRLAWSVRAQLPGSDYPIFENQRQVPLAVWFNRDLIVERFLPERVDGHFVLRVWTFLGDRETNSMALSEVPVVKGRTIVRRHVVDEVPSALRQMRRDLGFDFGKFDYGIVDGQVVLYDTNRTPIMGAPGRRIYMSRMRLMAEGIQSLFGSDT